MITTCDNCLQDFKPDNELVFICDDCKGKLKNCPKCGSDDISFDWQIHEPIVDYVYYYSIRCNSCEHEVMQSYHLDEGHQAAAVVFAVWQKVTV
jgi:hypothetical protein